MSASPSNEPAVASHIMEELTPDTVETVPASAPLNPTASVEQGAPIAAPEKPAKVKASPLVKEAQAFVTELFANELTAKLTYHSLRHTEAVVKECRVLATAAALGPDDAEALLLAAWFHDTGYLDVYDGHEFRSMERAAAWLAGQDADAARIQLVQDLIAATHRDAKATTCHAYYPILAMTR